jgi:hypothetical protein
LHSHACEPAAAKPLDQALALGVKIDARVAELARAIEQHPAAACHDEMAA